MIYRPHDDVPPPDYTNDVQPTRSQLHVAGVMWNNRQLLRALRALLYANTQDEYDRAWRRGRELLTELQEDI